MPINVSSVLLFLMCLLLAGMFAAAETSLFALVDARVHEMVNDATKRRRRIRSLLRLWLERPDGVLTAILLGKHTAHTLLILGAVLAVDDGAQNALQRWPTATAAVVGVVGVIVTVELFARTFAKSRASLVAPVVFPVVFATYYVTLPIVFALTQLVRVFSKVVGGSLTRSGAFVTEQDIVEMIALGRSSGTIDKVEGQMLAGVMELGETRVKELMVPRANISAVAMSATFDEVMAEVREQGHSRIPIYESSLDDIRGFFHSKDLLSGGIDPKRFRLREHLRPVEFVPELMRVHNLLRLFQKKKTHLAVVVDEFGGTSGIVALEDVLEEIVGPIHDEHDEEDAAIKRLSETKWSAEGRASLYDLGETLSLVFPDGGYETLGGFLIARCGRMPRTGDRVSFSGFSFLVAAADERKVARVDIEKTEKTQATSTPPEDAASVDAESVGADNGAAVAREAVVDDGARSDEGAAIDDSADAHADGDSADERGSG
jgi:putative hemolysin